MYINARAHQWIADRGWLTARLDTTDGTFEVAEVLQDLGRTDEALAPVYEELADQFDPLVDVLGEVSEKTALTSPNDLLRLYATQGKIANDNLFDNGHFVSDTHPDDPWVRLVGDVTADAHARGSFTAKQNGTIWGNHRRCRRVRLSRRHRMGVGRLPVIEPTTKS